MAALLIAAVLEGALRPDLPWRAFWTVVAAGLVPTLLWRRSRPLLMVVVAFGGCGVAPLVTGGNSPELYALAIPPVLLAYALVRWGSGRHAVAGSVVMVGKIGVDAVLGVLGGDDVTAGLVFLVAAGALGATFRYRASAREHELDQVKLRERERLARDLHDTVAHHVSAMAIRAQAGLAMSGSDPTAAVAALRLIEAEAARALDEMRAVVRVLRRGHPAELTPSPRIANLAQLAGPAHSGPAVDVEISGGLDDLPPSVGTTVYRLAQESVTNARRHARRATRIKVRVAADKTSVHLRVSDDGEAGPARPAGRSGYGLIGMAERADLVGGVCQAGPNPDRGWTVTAVLPRTATAE